MIEHSLQNDKHCQSLLYKTKYVNLYINSDYIKKLLFIRNGMIQDTIVHCVSRDSLVYVTVHLR